MGLVGFVRLGQDHHPIPWNSLCYDTNKGGRVSDIAYDQLQGAPLQTDDWSTDRALKETFLSQ